MSTAPGGEFILLVEDNPDDAELLTRVLRKSKFTVPIHHAHDGQEALDFLFGKGPFTGRDLHAQPSLVLLDLNLPKIDGFRVLMRIRADERTRNTPVVIVTGSKAEETLLADIQHQVIVCLHKPIDNEQLFQVLEQVGLHPHFADRLPPSSDAPKPDQSAS